MAIKISKLLNTYLEYQKIKDQRRIFKAQSFKLNRSNAMLNMFIGSFVLMMTLKFVVERKEMNITELYKQKNLIGGN